MGQGMPRNGVSTSGAPFQGRAEEASEFDDWERCQEIEPRIDRLEYCIASWTTGTAESDRTLQVSQSERPAQAHALSTGAAITLAARKNRCRALARLEAAH